MEFRRLTLVSNHLRCYISDPVKIMNLSLSDFVICLIVKTYNA